MSSADASSSGNSLGVVTRFGECKLGTSYASELRSIDLSERMLCDETGVRFMCEECFLGISYSGMFASEERFEDEKLRLRLSDVSSDELELLGVIRELPKLLDGRGTSYSSILEKQRLVDVLELERID